MGRRESADLFSGCERLGMPAIAITDHGSTFGAYEFYRASKASGVKPIIGMEAYVTWHSRTAAQASALGRRKMRRRLGWGGAFTHMTCGRRHTVGMHKPELAGLS